MLYHYILKIEDKNSVQNNKDFYQKYICVK